MALLTDTFHFAFASQPSKPGPEFDPTFGTPQQNGGDNVWAPGYGTGSSQGDDNPFQPEDNTPYENGGNNPWAPNPYDDVWF